MITSLAATTTPATLTLSTRTIETHQQLSWGVGFKHLVVGRSRDAAAQEA